MEALSSSILPSRLADTSAAAAAASRHHSSIPSSPFRLAFPKPHLHSFNAARAIASDGGVLGNRWGSIPDVSSSWFQSNLIDNGSGEGDTAEVSDMAAPPPVGSGASGSRAGLFRAPISGGVQSATSAHGLPRPALAVRNLMEQARFAHLCTVMSRMHHRRAGYPFGSLVDFATDSMGRM